MAYSDAEGQAMAVRPTFRLTEVQDVQFEDGRNVRVIANDTLRGTVEIELNEDSAQWFFACMADKIRAWHREDDAAERE